MTDTSQPSSTTPPGETTPVPPTMNAEPISPPLQSKPATEPINTPPTPPIPSAPTPPPPAPPSPSTGPIDAKPKNHWHISKPTIFLIIILGGLAAFLFYLAVSPKQQEKNTQVALNPTPTPYAQSLLSFEQSKPGTSGATLTPTPANKKTASYDVVLTTNANTVNAVQLELGFDPLVIAVNEITAGPFLANSVQLTKDINNKTGRVSYAIGVGPNSDGVTGTGVVATLSLEFLPTATASSTTISFLPKTLVAAKGVNPSVLKSTTDLIINLLKPTLSPTAFPLTTTTIAPSPTAAQ